MRLIVVTAVALNKKIKKNGRDPYIREFIFIFLAFHAYVISYIFLLHTILV